MTDFQKCAEALSTDAPSQKEHQKEYQGFQDRNSFATVLLPKGEKSLESTTRRHYKINSTRMTTIALSSDQIRLNAPNTYTNNLIVSGAINGASGFNIGYKLPISFTTNRNININGTTFSCYDIDLTKYVKSIALDGYNIRQFRSWCI
jgi:hypothetical protein